MRAAMTLYDELQPGDWVIVKAWAHGERVGMIDSRRRDGRLRAWKENLDLPSWSGPMDLFPDALLRRAEKPEIAAAKARRGEIWRPA